MYENDSISALTGVLHYTYDNYKLEPRDSADFFQYASLIKKASDLNAGDLVITEIMASPDLDTSGNACSDDDGEYIEIYNTRFETVDLRDLFIQDANDITNGTGTTVDSKALLAPGNYAVGIHSGSNNCYGLTSSFEFGFNLNNTGDLVTLSYGQTEIDTVDFSTWSITEGASLELSVSNISATDNDDATNWCDATSSIGGGSGDLGTPGDANSTCN